MIIDELFTYKAGSNLFLNIVVDQLESQLDEGSSVDKKKLVEKIKDSFKKIYAAHGFDDATVNREYDIYKIMKLFMILGKTRFYIEYDKINQPTEVKNIHYLDPRLYKVDRLEKVHKDGKNVGFYKISKTSYFEHAAKANSAWSGVMGAANSVGAFLPAVAFEAQIIDINWRDLDVTSHQSYVASLERSFNIYRTMERTRISWAVMNATFRSVNIIPTKGQGKVKSRQTLRRSIAKYGESVEFNDNTGVTTVNGEVKTRFNKEVWMAETSSGTPQFNNQGLSGPDLSDMESTGYFLNRFNKATKLPPSMLDREQQNFWSEDPTSIALEYVRFQKWLDRIRRAHVPMIAKPVWSEITLDEDFSWVKGDAAIRNMINVEWYTRDTFTKQLELTILDKTVSTIEGLSEITIGDDGLPLLSKRKLLLQFTDLTEDDLAEHRVVVEADAILAKEDYKKFGDDEE